MKSLGKLFFILPIVLLVSCYYDVEEELYPSTDCDYTGVTYSATIMSILQSDCLSCHNNNLSSGNINLEGYDNVKKYVDNGELLGSVKHQSGYSPMPKNLAPLLDCEIGKIEYWINQGSPNN